MQVQVNYPLGVHLSLQNVNIWGQAPQIQVTDKTGGLSVFEAYAVFPLADKFSAKVGRQMIALDDDRIFGSLDWHPAWKKPRRFKYSTGILMKIYKSEVFFAF